MIDVILDLFFGDINNCNIVNYLSLNYDIVSRFNGDSKYENIIYHNNNILNTKLIPSGFINDKKCIIGNGVIINPITLKNEIEMIESMNIDIRSNLYISKYSHIITPYHIYDNIKSNIDDVTSCYTSKINKTGVRLCDINDDYIKLFDDIINYNNYDKKYDDMFINNIIEYVESLKYLKNLKISNLEYYLNDRNNEILAEGSHGVLMDVGFGIYQYSKCYSTTIGSVLNGLGVSNQNIRNVYGIFKPYISTNEKISLLTEIKGKYNEKIKVNEHTSYYTNNKLTKYGWLDILYLKYACNINGITELIMLKTDILNDFDEIKICIGYTYFDDEYQEDFSLYRYDDNVYKKNVKPIYKKFKGWNTIDNKSYLEDFIQYIENETGIKITIISTGQENDNIYYRY